MSSPVAGGGNEVEAAVYAVILQLLPLHARLFVEILLKLGVHVCNDGGPATQGEALMSRPV